MRTRWKIILGITFLISGLALCVWGATRLQKQDQYRACAKVLTDPDIILLDKFTDPAQGVLLHSRMGEEILSLFRSPMILSNAITRLNLNKTAGTRLLGNNRPTAEESIKAIRDKIKPFWIRGTRLVAVEVCNSQPDEAAAIANAVIESFRDYRVTTICREPAEKRLEALEAKFEKDEQLIPLLRSNLDLLRETYRVKESDLDPLTLPVSVPASQLWSGSPLQMETLVRVKHDYERERFVFANVQSLSKEQRRNYVYFYYSGYEPEEWGPREKLLNRYFSAEKEHTEQTNYHALSSFKIQRLRRVIDKLGSQINEDADEIMRTQEHRMQFLKAGPESLTQKVRAAQKDGDKMPYWEKWHELEDLVALQKERAEKVASGKILLQDPKNSLVKITDRAEPPKFPAGPDRVLGLEQLIGGVCMIVGGAWLVRRRVVTQD